MASRSALTSAEKSGDHKLDIEPNSDHTLVWGNVYRDNGRHPAAVYTERRKAPGGDLYWDGTGIGNVWRENGPLVTHPRFARRTSGDSARQGVNIFSHTSVSLA